jgi:NADH-ubiquinone oxidoreductase chain 2
VGCLSSFNIFFVYFIIYSVISFRIIFFFNYLDFKGTIVEGIFLKGWWCIRVLLFLFFSLRGIPPFLGFLPKWLIIEILRGIGITIVGLIILLGSLLNIFYYLKITINIILRSFNLVQGNYIIKVYFISIYYYFKK